MEPEKKVDSKQQIDRYQGICEPQKRIDSSGFYRGRSYCASGSHPPLPVSHENTLSRMSCLSRANKEYSVGAMREYGDWLRAKDRASESSDSNQDSSDSLPGSKKSCLKKSPKKTKRRGSLGAFFSGRNGPKKEVVSLQDVILLPEEIAPLMLQRQACTTLKVASNFDSQVAELENIELIFGFATQPVCEYGEIDFDDYRFIDAFIKAHKDDLHHLLLEVISLDLQTRLLSTFPYLFRGDTFACKLASKVCDIFDVMDDGSKFCTRVAENMLACIQSQDLNKVEELVITSKDIRAQLEQGWIACKEGDFSELGGEEQNTAVKRICESRVDGAVFLDFIEAMLTTLFPVALRDPLVMGVAIPAAFKAFLSDLSCVIRSEGAKKRPTELDSVDPRAVAIEQVGALVFLRRINSQFVLEAKRGVDRFKARKESSKYRHAVGVYAAALGVSKVLQAIVNGAGFGEKEQEYLILNEHLRKYFGRSRNCLQRLAGIRD